MSDTLPADRRERAAHLLSTIKGLVIETLTDVERDIPGNGIPSGLLYAAMLSVVSLEAYTMLIALMISEGTITKRGDIIYLASGVQRG